MSRTDQNAEAWLSQAAETLTKHADALAAGATLFDLPDGMRSLKALDAIDPGVDHVRAYRSEMADRLKRDVHESPGARKVIAFMASVPRWEGPTVDLEEAGIQISPQLGTPGTSSNEGLAEAGVILTATSGWVRMSRMQWFFTANPAHLKWPDGRATTVRQEGRVPNGILEGAWRGLGIDPLLCAYCLVRPFEEVEHFVPLSRGGADEVSNLFPSCITCNRGRGGKHAKDPWVWLSSAHPGRIEFFRSLMHH